MAFQDQTGITPRPRQGDQAATEANGENPLFEMERGEITEVAFLEKLTDGLEPLLGHRPEMHRFKEIYFEALEPNPEMIELMRELKAEGYRMAMLTNNVREWEPLWRSMLPVDEIFETVVDSGFVGCRKPERRSTADPGADRPPAEACLFVDDVAGQLRRRTQGRDQRRPLPGQRAGDRRDPRRARRSRLAAGRAAFWPRRPRPAPRRPRRRRRSGCCAFPLHRDSFAERFIADARPHHPVAPERAVDPALAGEAARTMQASWPPQRSPAPA